MAELSTSRPIAGEAIEIDGLDMDARGVGRLPNSDGMPGKVVFVEGALPGEFVTYRLQRTKKRFEIGRVDAVLRASSSRVQPKCRFFGTCGGCSMQHLEPRAQVSAKQRVLEDNLAHLGRATPGQIFRPIHGPDWGYRYRARLSVYFVPTRGGVRLGFMERHSREVTEMSSCEVLPPHLSAMIMPLRGLINRLSVKKRLPQVEVAVGTAVTALVLRILAPLNAADETHLQKFADEHQVQFWLQPAGPESAEPFYPLDVTLDYQLPQFGLSMPFKPTDFTQVNHRINQVLVSRALALLEPRAHERILDLFCGLGNFTLPLACSGAEVMGIEGNATLTARAADNAKANSLESRTSFATRNLFEIDGGDLLALGRFDKILIDPPREGAWAVVQALAAWKDTPDAAWLPTRIVYVSCNPATLARDAECLVHQAGYRLSGAGVVNMFPHTSHVESIAVFDLIV